MGKLHWPELLVGMLGQFDVLQPKRKGYQSDKNDSSHKWLRAQPLNLWRSIELGPLEHAVLWLFVASNQFELPPPVFPLCIARHQLQMYQTFLLELAESTLLDLPDM